MPQIRQVTVEERRARLGVRHHLAASARLPGTHTGVTRLASDLVGLHGSDPASVFLSAAARMKRPIGKVGPVDAVERALYDDRTVVRTLGMRRTMFVVPLDLVPVVQAACTDPLVPGQRRRVVQMLEEHGIARDGRRWLRKAEAETLAAIEAAGEATGAELSRAVPALAEKVSVGEGKKWAGTIGMSTRVLFLLSTEQKIVRGRPKGSWTSSQYRWSPMDAWLPAGVPSMPPDEARAELVRRWLHAFGPATTNDLKWWTGWTLTQTRAALAAVGATEVLVELQEGSGQASGRESGWLLPDDAARVRAPRPWVALLPALDPTIMGWQARDWYLGDHRAAVFDRNGNAGPTVWADGRVVGGWAQRPSGEVVWRLLEDVGRTTRDAVAANAADLESWVGDVRITPRFPTPLHKELLA